MDTTLTTSRLLLRPWRESDAEALYEYARDPAVGPIAGWAPHTSVAYSLEIIRTVFAAPEVYALVLKETGEPVGSAGIIIGDGLHSAAIGSGEAEIGYWIGKPYWGQGLVPEAVRCLLRRCFTELGLSAMWCGYFDGNHRSRRVMEKCGFTFHHTEMNKDSSLGDLRTEHFMRLTREEWEQSGAMPSPRALPLEQGGEGE
ncbi:MAG: GNAT family N-acetyltransferase [Bacteroidaceae bacterium]|jgi:RimJ/RimL family protein N-acetyltransferase